MAVISLKNKLKSGSLLVGNTAYDPTEFESIATVTVGSGGSSTITFSSIPSTYKHLQIRIISRCAAASGASTTIRFNSDSGSNYTRHYLGGDGSTTYAGANTSTTGMNDFIQQPVSGALANTFGAAVWDILDYANTNKYKTVRALTGLDLNGSGEIDLFSGLWQSTSAISTITITGTNNFAQYSHFALYGIGG